MIMNKVIINGRTIVSNGSIHITNSKVIIDGKDETPNAKEINVSIEGNIQKLEIDACNKITVKGEVGKIDLTSGNIDVSGNITGSVKTMNGNIDCQGSIHGDASTMCGNVKSSKK